MDVRHSSVLFAGDTPGDTGERLAQGCGVGEDAGAHPPVRFCVGSSALGVPALRNEGDNEDEPSAGDDRGEDEQAGVWPGVFKGEDGYERAKVEPACNGLDDEPETGVVDESVRHRESCRRWRRASGGGRWRLCRVGRPHEGHATVLRPSGEQAGKGIIVIAVCSGDDLLKRLPHSEVRVGGGSEDRPR